MSGGKETRGDVRRKKKKYKEIGKANNSEDNFLSGKLHIKSSFSKLIKTSGNEQTE